MEIGGKGFIADGRIECLWGLDMMGNHEDYTKW